MKRLRPTRDLELVQIVDRALVDSERRAGDWIACRPGCTQCCVGAFAITQLDAERLCSGMDELRRSDPARARRVRQRAKDYLSRVAADFPGDIRSGILDESAQGQETFETFADEEICPALDPETGLCDVYEHRPMTCRVFGPPVRNEGGGLGVCELCFHGASDKQIAACELIPDPNRLEDELLAELEASGQRGNTIVACVLAED